MGAWGRGALEVGASAVSGGSGPGSRVAPPGGTPGSGARAGSGGAGARAGVPGAAAGGRPAEECGRAAGGAAPPPGAARTGRRRGLRAGRGRERESGSAAGGPRQGVAAGPTGPRGRWAAVGSCCPCPETPRTWPGRAPSPGFSWAGRAGGGGRGRAGGVGRGRHHRRPPAARPHLGGPPARTWAGSSQPRAGRWERKRGRVHGDRAGLPELGARGRRGRVCRCGRGRPRSTPAQEEPSGNRRRARVEPAQADPTCSRPRGLAGVRRGCRAGPGPFPGAPLLGRHGLACGWPEWPGLGPVPSVGCRESRRPRFPGAQVPGLGWVDGTPGPVGLTPWGSVTPSGPAVRTGKLQLTHFQTMSLPCRDLTPMLFHSA